MNFEDVLVENFIKELNENDKDKIRMSWEKYNLYVQSLIKFGKDYNERRYNLTRKIYEEWKSSSTKNK